jgi:hypothetical protein
MGGGDTQTSSSGPPAWMEPYLMGNIQNASQVASQPYQAYDGQRVADPSAATQMGWDSTINQAQKNGQMNDAAQQALMGQMQNGGYRSSGQVTPWGSYTSPSVSGAGTYASAKVGDPTQYSSQKINPTQQYQSQQINDAGRYATQNVKAANPFSSQQVSSGQNAYSGSNPFLQGMIDNSAKDITRGYQSNVVNADAAAARAGAFGGSEWQQQQKDAADVYTKNLAQNSNNYRFGDYTTQQGLAENSLNRGVGVQQFNSQMGQQDANSNAARDMAAQTYNSQAGAQDFSNWAGRNMNAQQFNSQMGQQDANSFAGRDMASQQFNSQSGQQDYNTFGARQDANQRFNSQMGQQDFNNFANRDVNAQQFNVNQNAQDWQSSQQRMLQAMGLSPQLAQAGYAGADAMGKVGNQMDQINQANLNTGYQDYQQAMGYNQQQQDIMNRALGLNYGTTQTQTTQQDPFNQLAGLGLAGTSLFSDRRLKENIAQVGKMDNGLPIYTYRYKGEEATHMGVMADEAEKVFPDAVATHPSGYKMVNYGALNNG